MSLEDYETKLSELEYQDRKIRGSIRQLKEEMAGFCPVEIGDEVEVNGYSYRGKIMVVEKIQYIGENYVARNTKFRCTGPILKADGTPGRKTGDHYV